MQEDPDIVDAISSPVAAAAVDDCRPSQPVDEVTEQDTGHEIESVESKTEPKDERPVEKDASKNKADSHLLNEEANSNVSGQEEATEAIGAEDKAAGADWSSLELCTPRRIKSIEPDMIVVVGGIEFHHYQAILLSSASILEDMLTTSHENRIEFLDMDPHGWLEVYKFLDLHLSNYASSGLDFNIKNTKDLDLVWPWFHRLEMRHHLSFCDGEMSERMWRSCETEPPKFSLWEKYKSLDLPQTKATLVSLAKRWSFWFEDFPDLALFLEDDDCGSVLWEFFTTSIVRWPDEMIRDLDRREILSSPLFKYMAQTNRQHSPKISKLEVQLLLGMEKDGNESHGCSSSSSSSSLHTDEHEDGNESHGCSSSSSSSSLHTDEHKPIFGFFGEIPSIDFGIDLEACEEGSYGDSDYASSEVSEPPKKKAPATLKAKVHDSDSSSDGSITFRRLPDYPTVFPYQADADHNVDSDCP